MALVVVVVGLFGCAKNTEFVNPVYECGCGSATFDGVNRPLVMAEYLLDPDTNFFSRRYYTTMDLSTANETEPHHLNMSFYVDTVINGLFTLEEDDLQIKIEEVNYNDPFIPIRQYEANIAFIEVTPAITNGNETVSFQMQVNEVLNGSPAGLPFAYSGTFNLNVIY